jgi:RNA polymerase sigma-70 factor (ECF subfamily)
MGVAIEPTDEELLRRMREGDEDAFVTLYRRRQGGVYRYALQMSGSEATAEDVAQEVFMVLMRDSHKFDAERGSLAGYLFGIARNLTLRRLERSRVFVPIGDDDEGAVEVVADGVDPYGDLNRTETVELVRQAVRTLPDHYREAVVLCDLNELSYAEAADVLGCAVGTVRSRLHRGRSILVDRLKATRSAPSPAVNVKRCFA